MRNLAIADRAARSVKTKVRNVVLAAGIEAAADLDVKILDRVVELEELFAEAAANFAGQPSR